MFRTTFGFWTTTFLTVSRRLADSSPNTSLPLQSTTSAPSKVRVLILSCMDGCPRLSLLGCSQNDPRKLKPEAYPGARHGASVINTVKTALASAAAIDEIPDYQPPTDPVTSLPRLYNQKFR